MSGAEWFLKRRRADPAFGASVPVGDARFYLVRDEAKKGPCWTGYHKVAGKADYADGSCAKNGESKTKKKKRRKRPSKTEKGKESSTDASSSDDEKKKKKPPSKD